MKKKKNGMAYAYLAPTLITILLVTCLPILYTVILSFTNYNTVSYTHLTLPTIA